MICHNNKKKKIINILKFKHTSTIQLKFVLLSESNKFDKNS